MKATWSRIGFLTSLCLLEGVALAQAAPVDGTAVAGSFADLKDAGMAAIERQDYVAAEADFRKARALALQEGRTDLVTELDARRAARYINAGEASRAEIILAPYVKPGVDKFMLADYFLALRLCNQPRKVLSLYNEYVKEPADFPAYGLQTVGDVCLRQGKYRQAIEIYGEVLKRDKPEDVPFVQLGYAYSLARLGKKTQALEAYGKLANKNPRWDNIIAMDGEAMLGLGRISTARKMFALLGKDDRERERYDLRYARSLVDADHDYQNEALNFRRDEILSGRSYRHEAEKILKRLQRSEDEEIAAAARTLRASNFLKGNLYADSRALLQAGLEEDPGDMAVQAVLGEYDRTVFNSLTTYYENSLDNKRNLIQGAGLNYEGYLGGNTFFEAGFGRRWLQDDTLREALWQESFALERSFENWRLRGEWLGYQGTKHKQGFELSLGYDLNDLTSLSYAWGRRLHEHAAAVRDGITEHYHELSLRHQLNHLTALEGHYGWASLSDDNKYRNYGLSLSYLLGVRHNFSDRLRLQYEHGSYDREADYDSPWRRVSYGAVFTRKWNLPRQNAYLEWQTGLEWGHDNDEGTGFVPSLGLNYVKNLPHNQQLQVGAVYYRYFNQIADADNRRRNDGCSVNVSYSWRW